MVSRRTFLSLVAASMSAPRAAFAQPETRKVALYANVGADLTHYDDDTIAEITMIIAWENASSRFNRAFRIPSQGFWKP